MSELKGVYRELSRLVHVLQMLEAIVAAGAISGGLLMPLVLTVIAVAMPLIQVIVNELTEENMERISREEERKRQEERHKMVEEIRRQLAQEQRQAYRGVVPG